MSVVDEDLWARASASDVGVRVRVVTANLVGAVLVAIEAVLVGERAAYDAISTARVDFVPARSMTFARGYAAANGLPAPW